MRSPISPVVTLTLLEERSHTYLDALSVEMADRLRPAPFSRTPLKLYSACGLPHSSYNLQCPGEHFKLWYQDLNIWIVVLHAELQSAPICWFKSSPEIYEIHLLICDSSDPCRGCGSFAKWMADAKFFADVHLPWDQVVTPLLDTYQPIHER